MKKNLLIFISGFLVLLCYSCQKKTELAVPETLLLKNYRPASIYNIPKIEINRAKFPVIDAHSHTYAKSTEEIEQWISIMEELGIEKTLIIIVKHLF
jgi:hypothetical protein